VRTLDCNQNGSIMVLDIAVGNRRGLRGLQGDPRAAPWPNMLAHALLAGRPANRFVRKARLAIAGSAGSGEAALPSGSATCAQAFS
jgi:hypothetical protein